MKCRFVSRGCVDIELDDGSTKRVGITRAHLEEDAGKSVHDLFPDETGVDLNRAGVPLLEIVSEPDMNSADEATAYMRAIHSLVRYLGICDGNMEEGSFRCDANVSVRRAGQGALGTRTEIKNLNSFRFIERAINYERERQIDVLEGGRHDSPGDSALRSARERDAGHARKGRSERLPLLSGIRTSCPSRSAPSTSRAFAPVFPSSRPPRHGDSDPSIHSTGALRVD